MIANLKRAFKSLVKEADWVDPVTKSVIINKVDSMVELVGHPSWILNSTAMEEYYKTVNYYLLFYTEYHYRNCYCNFVFSKILTVGDVSKVPLSKYATRLCI